MLNYFWNSFYVYEQIFRIEIHLNALFQIDNIQRTPVIQTTNIMCIT